MRILERHIPMPKGASGNGLQLAKRVLADQAIMWVSPLYARVGLFLVAHTSTL